MHSLYYGIAIDSLCSVRKLQKTNIPETGNNMGFDSDKTILIIDDDTWYTSLLSEELQDEGYTKQPI